MGRIIRFASALALILTAGVGLASRAVATSASASDVYASYNGVTIDLTQGWSGATVCVIALSSNNCFANTADYEMSLGASLPSLDSVVIPLTSCTPGLKLFENINYGGRELIVQTEAVWINLSDVSFSDITSSFKVGACSVEMTDAANGGGSVYPGPTSSGSNVSWIGSAWNDRIASVLIR
jgi:hypothetical protein